MTIENAQILPFSTVSGTGAPVVTTDVSDLHEFLDASDTYDIPVVYVYNSDASSQSFRLVHSGAGGTQTDISTGNLPSQQGTELIAPGQFPYRGGKLLASGTNLNWMGNISRITQ